MAQITGLSLISAVTKTIRDAIPITELKVVYKDKPQQGMVKPCAFVHQIEAEHRQSLRLRGERFYTIDIRCHPEDKQSNINTWAYQLSDKIIAAVQSIYLLNDAKYPIRARKLSWRVEQDVLHVIASYSLRVTSIEDGVDMDKLSYGERVKK